MTCLFSPAACLFAFQIWSGSLYIGYTLPWDPVSSTCWVFPWQRIHYGVAVTHTQIQIHDLHAVAHSENSLIKIDLRFTFPMLNLHAAAEI
ncbi:hypothetical protein ACJX0J_033831, partial [Zea mays]